MNNSGPVFTQQEFERILTRRDGLTHILLSDVENITKSLQTDFNDIIKVRSIGKSWEGKDINVIELDAIKVLTNPPVQAPPVPINQNKSAAQVNQIENPLIIEPKTMFGDSLLLAQTNNQTDFEGEFIAVPAKPPTNPSIVVTGAHHARELITIQMVMYSLLKLIQEGIVHKNPDTL